MENIAYKSYMHNPINTFQVYFTCHPKDYSRYFPSVAESLFNAKDCVVWYGCNNDRDWKEKWELDCLDQMELIVIPITYRFFQEKNPAKNVIVPFAKGHDIPILPLIEEDGLEDKVQELFGANLVFFAHDYDIHIDSYGKKMREAISSAVSIAGMNKYKSWLRRSSEEKNILNLLKNYKEYCTKLYKNRYSKKDTEQYKKDTDQYFETLRDYINALSHALSFTDLYKSQIEKDINEMYNVCTYLSSEFSVTEKLYKQVVSEEYWANLLAGTYDFSHAKEIYNFALNDAIKLVQMESNAETLLELCSIYQELARCSYHPSIKDTVKDTAQEKNIQEQITYYRYALETAKKMFEVSKAMRYCNKLCDIYYKLGTCLEEHSLLIEDALCFEDERKIIELYYGETERPEVLNNLYDCYSNLGKVYKKLGDLNEAESFYKKALEIIEVGLDKDFQVSWLNLKKYIFSMLSDLADEKDNPEDAERYKRKSLEAKLRASLIKSDGLFDKGESAYYCYKEVIDSIDLFRNEDPDDSLITDKDAFYRVEKRVCMKLEDICRCNVSYKNEEEADCWHKRYKEAAFKQMKYSTLRKRIYKQGDICRWEAYHKDEKEVESSHERDKEVPINSPIYAIFKNNGGIKYRDKILMYKSKKNTDSCQESRMIYFTAHPDDQGHYYGSVLEDINKSQDCSLWYDPEYDHGWNKSDLELNIGHMQLIVIPVTTRFLNDENPARDVIVPFANRKHIPILPLLQEKVSMDDYTRVFQDTQYIDKQSLISNYTETVFEKKLEDYLSSILLDKELVNEIKSAIPHWPEIINASNEKTLSKELVNDMQSVVSEEQYNISYYLYLIGLAYLKGINIEEKQEYGVDLITQAASQQSPEAIKKLAQIYEFGDGVEKDSEVSLYWYKELVKYWKEGFDKNPENIFKYIDALKRLVNIQSVLGMEEEPNSIYLEIVLLISLNPELIDDLPEIFTP